MTENSKPILYFYSRYSFHFLPLEGKTIFFKFLPLRGSITTSHFLPLEGGGPRWGW
jgi:hypothetical protein